MTEPKAPIVSLQAQYAKTLSTNLIQNFASLLITEAKKNGGTASPGLIEAMTESFISDNYSLSLPEALCEKIREEVYWDTRRRHPFDRLLMHRFFHLLSDYTSDHGEEPQTTLSRQLIPGFIVALTRTIGLEIYEQSQYKTQRLLSKFMEEEAEDETASWDNIYEDEEATRLTDSVLVVFAHCFKKFEIRIGWMVEVINSHLPPINEAYPQQLWKLRPSGCAYLLDALFSDIQKRASANPLMIRSNYGDEADARLSAFLNDLNHTTKKNQVALALAV